MTTLDLPVIAACSLEPDGMAARAAGFRSLLTPSLRALRRAGARAELDLALDDDQERALGALLALERECCPFWRFTLTRRSPGLVRLDVRAAAAHEVALDAFLSLAGTAAPEEETFRAGVGVETRPCDAPGQRPP